MVQFSKTQYEMSNATSLSLRPNPFALVVMELRTVLNNRILKNEQVW